MKHVTLNDRRSTKHYAQMLSGLLLAGVGHSDFVFAQTPLIQPAPTQASAVPPMANSVQGQTQSDARLVTVEELMRLDAQAALRLARRGQFDDHLTVAPRPANVNDNIDTRLNHTQSTPVVHAIYGIGRALKAEIQVGQDVHVLESKNKRVTAQQGTNLELEKIIPPCVHIKRDHRAEVLCLKQERP